MAPAPTLEHSGRRTAVDAEPRYQPRDITEPVQNENWKPTPEWGKKSTKTKRRKQKAKRKKVVGPTVPCWRPHTFTDVHVFYVNRRSELGEGHSETRTSPSLNTHTHTQKKKRKRVLWWWWWWWYAGGPDLEAGRRFCADWRPGVMEVLRVSGVLTCCGVE